MAKKTNPIQAAHYSGIGKIIVSWARLENHVIRALEAILKLNTADALVVFWHMSHRERVARLVSLFYMDHGDRNDSVRVEFDTLIKRLNTAYDIRNAVGHGVWFKGSIPKSIKAFQMLAKGGDVKFTGKGIPPVEFTPDRLVSEARKIDRLATDFREFFETHCKARFVYKRK